QAEDGIRDFHVTGVQTCALPIGNSRSFLKAVLLVAKDPAPAMTSFCKSGLFIFTSNGLFPPLIATDSLLERANCPFSFALSRLSIHDLSPISKISFAETVESTSILADELFKTAVKASVFIV